MKTKQLANVLIKVLGLSIFIRSIADSIMVLFHQAFPISSLVLVAIGIYLIIQSRQVTALLFKDDSE